MELKRKSLLSLLLAGALFASISTETATLNFNLGDCVKWAQRSSSALFSSESFRKFAPAIVATGIVILGGMLWYQSRKKKDILSEKPTKNLGLPSNFGNEEKNNEQVKEAEIKEISAGRGTGLAECLSDSKRLEQSENTAHIDFVEQVILSKEEQNKVDAEQQLDRIYLASDTINIDGERVQGRKSQLSDNASIQQLAVLHQDTEEVINGKTISVGGGKASCGYQIIKNAFIALNWGKNIAEPLNSTQISRKVCSMPSDEVIGSWRKQIIELRRKDPAWHNNAKWFKEGEWLTEEELRKLIKNGNFFNDENYSIIDGVDILDLLKDEIAKKVQKGNSHVFLINTGSRGEKKINGHWFSMILKKKHGKRIWTVIDSKNIVRLYNDPWVKKIINTFDSEPAIINGLILPQDQQKAINNGINRLLTIGNMGQEERIRKLFGLKRWYQDWSGQQLSEDLQREISNAIISN